MKTHRKNDAWVQADQFRHRLQAIGTRKRAVGEKAYLKSQLRFLGVPVPAIRKLGKAFAKSRPDLCREELLDLVSAMWTDEHEMRTLAIIILDHFAQRLRALDMPFVEDRLRHCEGWAHVDLLAVRVAGAQVQRFAQARKVLNRWSRDENFWIRRSALLALLLELRSGEGDFDLFAKLADRLLDEKEFFIRKAIGWVLRESAKSRPELTERYLEQRISRVSGLSLREGAKNLPAATRNRLIAQHQAVGR